MRSEVRAWIVLFVLIGLWGTLAASPFRFFAEMSRTVVGLLTMRSFLPEPWQALLTYLLLAVLLAVLLLIGRGNGRVYLGGICALAAFVYQLVLSLRNGRIDSVSIAVAIGLALALLFLVVRANRPALWLSDAYILAIAAWILFDGVIPTVLTLLGRSRQTLSSFFLLAEPTLLSKLNGYLGQQAAVWSIVPLILALLPVIVFSSGRQKG